LEATSTLVARLIFEEPDGNREVSLDTTVVWKLGRSEKCEIVINDEMMSRTHAMIQRTEKGEYCFIDMGSRNGSFVNDSRVSTPVMLRSGDRISLGKTRMIFRDPGQVPKGGSRPSLGAVTQIAFTRCLVSILVVDIRDYTGLSQAIDLSVLSQVVGKWFGEADRILQKSGSTAQKYIGDAVMALWVHRNKGEEQKEILKVLRALTEFAEATAGLSQQFDLPSELRIGAGLNTGSAVIGNPGTHQVMDFTALGDTVNAAFHMETATQELGTDVVLGKDTFNYLRPLPQSTRDFCASEVMLKGHDQPAETWYISFSRLKDFLKNLDDGNRTLEEPAKNSVPR
jgi:adenylate cyclase